MRFQYPISAATALGPSWRNKINDACGYTVRPSVWDKVSAIRTTCVGLSRNAVSALSTGSCGTREIFLARWLSRADTSLKCVNCLPPTHSTFVKLRKEALHIETPSTARFEAYEAASLRSSFFWNVMQPSFMNGYRRFGTACQSYLPRSSSKRRALAFRMAPTSCPETSAAIDQPTMRYITQQRIPRC